MMWKFLRGGATVIPEATFIPESRVVRPTAYDCSSQWIESEQKVNRMWRESKWKGKSRPKITECWEDKERFWTLLIKETMILSKL